MNGCSGSLVGHCKFVEWSLLKHCLFKLINQSSEYMLARFLRFGISRETLILLYNLLQLLRKKTRSILSRIFSMAKPNNNDAPVEPAFDPTQPSVPISYPLKTLEELESRAYFDSFHYPFNKSSVPLESSSALLPLPSRPRILVCHDMQGGYVDDKFVQGGSNPDAYSIWHWYLMDVFVYFSHSLVTLPPPCWTNAAHRHGVKVLGTFITEWDEGRIISNKLLKTEDSARLYAERLAELAAALGFDGWLLNMEVKLDESQIPNLKEFVRHLTQTMHSLVPGSMVIWYDSVTIDGQLKWQDQLNGKNKAFFDICDGIFINYTWKKDYPKLSAEVAGDRKFDVYMGIDVFGRNTYGGGQWNTNVALDLIKSNEVSAAIFAPGWVYETKQPPDFQTAQNRWWNLVENSWGAVQKYPRSLPFYSSFDQGVGYHISIDGEQVTNASWNNISCQGFQPLLKHADEPKPDAIQVLVEESSYNGGANITFKGTLQDNAYFETRLFLGEHLLGGEPLQVTYSVKSEEGDSLLGLSLHFVSPLNDKPSVIIIAPWETDEPSRKFNKAIVPRLVTDSETSNTVRWRLYDSKVVMNGHILREIRAVCHRPKRSNNEFSAVLGHVLMKSSDQNSYLPCGTSWEVTPEFIQYGGDGSKSVSFKINWRLKDGITTFRIPRYNVYCMEKRRAGDSSAKYLGAAAVEAFYVSGLVVPPDVCSLKFIVQACGADGVFLELEDSPYFELEVEHKERL
ncbi:Cytosolic endo-beta-N-acetylglucosaminidase 1 [Linum grandiflorum]